MNARALPWLVAVAVCAATALLYAPVRDYPFVVLDDFGWVVENPLVNGGLSWGSARAAFTTAVQGNWVPLAWLSHQLDVTLFGLDAGGHHAVNVLLHMLASVALFVAFRRATGDTWPSAFVAMAFALHPLHVESVAWISERRDVLSGLFFALCLIAWFGHVRRRRPLAHAAALLAFALGALAKPMLVTLPILLLLLDGWPLGRLTLGARRLLTEKIGFLVVSAGIAAATVLTQSDAGAVASLEMLPVGTRLANALSSGAAYLSDAFWPAGLAAFYPYPDTIEASRVIAAALLLAGVTAYCVREWRERPWLLVGWAWFALMLLPVIGLVQVGSQARADRYMYLPLTGLLVAVAWTAHEWAKRDARVRKFVALVALGWLAFCALLASEQIATWRSSVALFEHARSVSGDAPIILVNLGEAYDRNGDAEAAIALYEAGLEGYAHAPRVRTRLGRLLVDAGRLESALVQLREALQRHPDEPRTRHELGRLLLRNGQHENALTLLAEEEARFPGASDTRLHLAEARAHAGQRDAAVEGFVALLARDAGVVIAPIDESARTADALAEAYERAGRPAEALQWTRRGILMARLAGDHETGRRLSAARPAREAAAGRKPHP